MIKNSLGKTNKRRLESTAGLGVWQNALAGAELIFTSGPKLTIPAGEWKITGKTRMSVNGTDSPPKMMQLKLWNNTDSIAFGYGSCLDCNSAKDNQPADVIGFIKCSSEKLIYLYAINYGSQTMNIGEGSTDLNGGYLVAEPID